MDRSATRNLVLLIHPLPRDGTDRVIHPLPRDGNDRVIRVLSNSFYFNV
jgi:hypothetical protein